MKTTVSINNLKQTNKQRQEKQTNKQTHFHLEKEKKTTKKLMQAAVKWQNYITRALLH